MKTLGVVLAGGRSLRFGSDKAEALFEGRTLIAHALEVLARHADAVAIVGRDWPGFVSIADLPGPGLGPLGGLCGALVYAAEQQFAQVLTCGVDCPQPPLASLDRCPSYLEAQPVIGLWPAAAAGALLEFLANDRRRSVRGFGGSIGAAAIQAEAPPLNINTPEDLAIAQRAKGHARAIR